MVEHKAADPVRSVYLSFDFLDLEMMNGEKDGYSARSATIGSTRVARRAGK